MPPIKGNNRPSIPATDGNKEDKVDYVRQQSQTREHHCHWPGCSKQVPPAKWGCYHHWMKLPKYLRDKIWAAYRPGQETDMRPSREYLAVAHEVQEWIKAFIERDNKRERPT